MSEAIEELQQKNTFLEKSLSQLAKESQGSPDISGYFIYLKLVLFSDRTERKFHGDPGQLRELPGEFQHHGGEARPDGGEAG